MFWSRTRVLCVGVVAGLSLCAGELAQPAGSSAVFGTPQRPRPCPSDLTTPTNGALTVDRAKAIFYCTNEREATLLAGHSILTLADDVEIRLAKQPRAATASDVVSYGEGLRGHIEMSRTLQVIDIKSSFRQTTCHSLPRYEAGAQCSAVYFAMSARLCFRDALDDWHCQLHRDSWRSGQPTDAPKR